MSRIFYQIKILLFWLNKFTFWSQEDFFYYKIGVMHHLRRYFPFFFTFLQIVKFMWDILLSALVRLGCFSNCVSFFLVQKFFSFLFSQGYSTSWSCLSGTTLKTEESEVLTLTQVTAFKKTKAGVLFIICFLFADKFCLVESFWVNIKTFTFLAHLWS